MSKLLVFFTLLTTLVAFQNCSLDGLRPKDTHASKGNGEGYGGKVVREYLRKAPAGECLDKTQVPMKSVIEQREFGFYLTVEDCQPVSPRLLDKSLVDVLAHNANFAIFEQKLFEDVKANSTTNSPMDVDRLCRGQVSEASGLISVHDIVVSQGRIDASRGVYSANGNAVESGRQTVTVQADPADPNVLVGNLAAPENLRVTFDSQGTQASLAYALRFGGVNPISANLTQTCFEF